MKYYTINEIFFSLQGEGIRTGSANIFIRFTGCNQTCNINSHGFDCDTEFISGRKMTLEEILIEVKNLSKECKWIILTGGEPALQVDRELTDFFHDNGYKLAIETNGSINIDDKCNIDWITVSPKVAEHCIRQLKANETKYVRGYGQNIPKTEIKSDYYLISPAFNGLSVDNKTLNWCVSLVKDNPKWSLSVQQHKLWNLR